MLLGVKAPKYFADVLSGESGLKFTSKTGGVVYINVVYAVSGNNTALSVARSGAGTSVAPYIIEVTVATNGSGEPTSTASQVKTAAEGVSDVNTIVDIALLGEAGSGVVEAVASSVLSYERYMEISEADDLLGLGFENTDLEYKKAQAFFAQNNAPSRLAVFLLTAWNQIETEIAALRNNGKDSWYKVFGTTNTKAEIIANSNYLASIKKRYVGLTSDITLLVGRNEERELLIFHSDPSNHPDARYLGDTVARQVGSYNPAYLRLSGVTNSGYSNSTTNSIINDKGNVIALFSGFQVFWPGITTGGAYDDVIDIRDWLQARLNEDVSSVFLNNPKIGYTTTSLALITTAMRDRFTAAGNSGMIAAVETDEDLTRSDLGDYQYKIIVPDFDSIPKNDRDNRVFPPIKFKVRLQGAINTVDIEGELD
ncbi:MAG: DUF3383 domain-containing protein [Leptospira sp.]|nr:DUF3383 domain-containing protein [Leptospira sp.]